MFRLALIALVLVVGLLLVLALTPERRRTVPDSTITLAGAEVILYPEADPEAVWTFEAPAVGYEPGLRETTLFDIENGARTENGVVDFTVSSDEIVIDRNDNLRGDSITVFLVESEDCLLMVSEGNESVLIDQREGRFKVPIMRITGPTWGDNSVYPRVRASFDLQEFEAGGVGTTVITELLTDRDDSRSTLCENP